MLFLLAFVATKTNQWLACDKKIGGKEDSSFL
jgi:hypothetical protein